MEFSGPPKLSRDVVPTLVNLSERLETADVDSLPALADEVAQGQKHQLAELQSRKQFLTQLKTEHEKIIEKVSGVKNEIRSIERNIFFIEDEIESKQKNIQNMIADMDHCFTETTSLNIKVTKLKSRLRHDQELYKASRNRMVNFHTRVKKSHEDSEMCKEIKKLEDERDDIIEQVNKFGTDEERKKLLSGEEHADLEKSIMSLSQQQEELALEIKSLENQIDEEGEKQKRVKIETAMLQKRNNAQMIRMKRQLQEGTGRNRNLADDIAQLENRITQMKSGIIG